MTAKRIKTLTLCAVCAMASNAQNTGEKAPYNKCTREDTLATVRVTGTARTNDISSAAPRFTLETGELARLGVSDIGGALRRLPGTTLRDYGGAGGLKTVSVRGFGAQHTAVVYDGVALSDCQTGQIDLSRYSIDNVEDLTLVVGDNDDILQPAKNFASAASLRINSQRLPTADTKAHITAQMRLGSWGMTNPFLKIEKNVSEHFGIGVLCNYTYAENDYPYTIKNVDQDVSDRRKNSRMNSVHTEMNIAWQPNNNHIVALKAYFYDNDRRLPGQVHYYVNESREQMHDQNAMAQLNWRWNASHKWKTAVIGKFNYTMADYKNPEYANHIQDHTYWQREAYASASVMYAANRNLAVGYSADYAYNNLSGSDVSTYRDPLRHTVLQTIAAKYSSGRITATARLLHSIYLNGARQGTAADDIRHLSPSLSLSWKVLGNEDLYVRMSYKDIFRAPSFNELYYEHYGSTDLKPECTRQLNVGATWGHGYGKDSRLELTADMYYNKVEDKIIAIPYNMFIWQNINLGRVRTLGTDITASLTQRLGKRHTMIVNANGTYQKVENDTDGDQHKGKQIAYTPKFSGAASVAWENPWANISVNAVMVSSRWANNEHYSSTMIKSYQDFGVTVYRDVHWGKCRMDLRLDVKNIFNKQYEIVRFYPMPGRAWEFTAKIKI